MAIRFSQAELARVPEAIRKAETGTQAEIFAVLAERSDSYRFVAYAFLALWILLFSAVLVLWWQWKGGGMPIVAESLFQNQWGIGGRGSNSYWLATVLVFGQIAAFVMGVLVMRMFPALAVAVTPGRIARERARANGIKQFLAHGIHNTAGRTGVLVFVSLNERYGEIFVDTAIEESVGREFFLEQVAVLIEQCANGNVIDGYVEVIGQIGAKLAEAFPVSPNDENEIENRFVIL